MVPWLHFNSRKILATNLFPTCKCINFSTTSNILKKTETDLYSLLKIQPNATQKQIKSAYYKLSLILHPDKNVNPKTSHDKFTQLTEAYKILGSINSRRNYDRSRKVIQTASVSVKDTHFNDDDVKKHRVTASRHYDTWTQSHYANSMTLRDDRIKRDMLRDTDSSEEKEGRKSRFVIVASLVFVFIPFYVIKKLRNKDP